MYTFRKCVVGIQDWVPDIKSRLFVKVGAFSGTTKLSLYLYVDAEYSGTIISALSKNARLRIIYERLKNSTNSITVGMRI